MSNKTLTIYNSSHPMIKIWSSHICYTHIPDYETIKIIVNVSTWLLFEIMRKSLSTYNLYIKQFYYINNISLLPNGLSHILIGDCQLMHIISKDLLLLIPECKIYLLYTYKYNNQLKIDFISNKIDLLKLQENKIIIFEQYLEEERIRLLISLINKYTKSINQIQICCIICTTDVLQFINENYSNIKIYTAKIINRNESINPFWKVLDKNYIY